MTWKANNSNIMTEVLATELCSDAKFLGKTSFSNSRSLKARPVLAFPVVGSESRYLVEANFAVFAVNSAEVPPMTMARW
ncbi:MAG: hypothetical protein RLZZ92_829 [Actinomycetota bacterium]